MIYVYKHTEKNNYQASFKNIIEILNIETPDKLIDENVQ